MASTTSAVLGQVVNSFLTSSPSQAALKSCSRYSFPKVTSVSPASFAKASARLVSGGPRVVSYYSPDFQGPSSLSYDFSSSLGNTSSLSISTNSSRGVCRDNKVAPGVRCMSAGATDLMELVKEKNAANPVIVYSKTYCPYCKKVKSLFQNLGVDFKAVEIDELVEDGGVQDALYKLTGQRTVPNVFIGGKHIGGCDDTVALNQSGKLLPLLESAGVKANK